MNSKTKQTASEKTKPQMKLVSGEKKAKPAVKKLSDNPEENIKMLVGGKITLAELQGVSREQAYAIAEIGYQLFMQGKYDRAKVIFDGLIALNPYDAYFHSVLGAIFAKTNEEDKAVQEFSIAINLSPHDPQVFVNRAELLLKKGKFEEAVEDLKSAIKLDPAHKQSSVQRAHALLQATMNLMRSLLAKKQEKK